MSASVIVTVIACVALTLAAGTVALAVARGYRVEWRASVTFTPPAKAGIRAEAPARSPFARDTWKAQQRAAGGRFGARAHREGAA